MLIVQIALGIVLAVVVLMFWDVILGLGVILLVLAVAAAGILYAVANPPVGGAMLLAALLGYAIYWDSKRRYSKPETVEKSDQSKGSNLSWRSLNTSGKIAVVFWLLLMVAAFGAALFVQR